MKTKSNQEGRLERAVKQVAPPASSASRKVIEQGEAIYSEMKKLGITKPDVRIVDPTEACPIEATFLGRGIRTRRPRVKPHDHLSSGRILRTQVQKKATTVRTLRTAVWHGALS